MDCNDVFLGRFSSRFARFSWFPGFLTFYNFLHSEITLLALEKDKKKMIMGGGAPR